MRGYKLQALAQMANKITDNRGTLGSQLVMSEARTRVRQRIRRLLEDRGLTGRALATHLRHSDQWVSNLLAGRFTLKLDELDAVAKFFGVPPGEIVRVSEEPWELTAEEMRMVRAMRMLPPVIREHLSTLADYLIGATPEEVTLLQRIRRLSSEDLRKIEHWLDLVLLKPSVRPETAIPLDLMPSTAPPVKRVSRIRHGRKREES